MLVMIWAVRIAGLFSLQQIELKETKLCLGFLLFRVLKMGSDNRFDEIRSHFWKFLGPSASGISIFSSFNLIIS